MQLNDQKPHLINGAMKKITLYS